MPANRWTGIGAMSGTSMDGLDLTCCTFERTEDRYVFSIDAAESLPLEGGWRDQFMRLYQADAETYAHIHVAWGAWLGQQMAAFIRRNDLTPDFAAMHGQTIFHQPERGFTSQIGDGEAAAAFLPCPLVSNFRVKDVVLGGQGAPLVPLGEKFLFPDRRLFLNLGGFSNLSFGGSAFDVAPCNIVLNALYRRHQPADPLGYDDRGALAASGQPLPELLAALGSLPFYAQSPPKSLGWEWVEQQCMPVLERFDAPLADLLHTVVLHIAHEIAAGLSLTGARNEPILVTGGGRHHHFLMEQIARACAPLGIAPDDTAPDAWTDYKEAIIFAFLGLRCIEGETTTLASVTGALQDAVTGAIHLPPGGGWRVVRI